MRQTQRHRSPTIKQRDGKISKIHYGPNPAVLFDILRIYLNLQFAL